MEEDRLGLEILKEVAHVASSTLDLDETLQKIIAIIKNKMRIDACAFYLTDGSGATLHLRAASGLTHDASENIQLEMGEGVTGWVAEHKRSLALSDAMQDDRFIHFPQIEEEKFHSMLSVPILEEDRAIGVINVHTLDRREFSDAELSILATIAEQVTGCLRNALQYHHSQQLLREQTILYDISLAVQTTLKMEHGLWVVLSGITMGEAGGFNRAMLFIINEKTRVLEGKMGVGPDSADDACRIWTEWGLQKKDLLKWVTAEADKDSNHESLFNQFVHSLRFRVQDDKNILAQAVLQKKSFNVTNAREHPLVSEEFMKLMGVSAFAVVPLIAHEEVLGVILVDNKYNGRPITREHLRLLTRFTTHASWVIENARLFSKLLDTNQELLATKEQLIHKEKLAALGEVSAEVTHEIKNPLVSIGGFARRLQKKLKTLPAAYQKLADLKKAADYSDIIQKEVSRLEKLLGNILQYSKASALDREEVNLNQVLKEVIFLFKSGLYSNNIKLLRKLDENLPALALDKEKIKQVFINLFYNAMDSMPEGGQLTVKTYSQKQGSGPRIVTFRMDDTGGGIPQEVFKNIFNPFFTTKSSGTGLGLSICRKIIENHGGTIQINNHIGKGITLLIHLPLQIIPDYYKTE